jgi:hypothetical protein
MLHGIGQRGGVVAVTDHQAQVIVLDLGLLHRGNALHPLLDARRLLVGRAASAQHHAHHERSRESGVGSRE